jgi:MFS family permease
VLAIYGAVLSASFALGPLLISVTGTEGFLPFLVAAGVMAAAGLPLLWSRGLSPVFHGRAAFGVLSFLLVAPTLAAAVFLSAFKEMSMGAILPVYGVRSGLTDSAAAAMLTACYLGALAFQLPIGWLADRMNRYLLLILLILAGLIGALLLPGIVALGAPLMWLGLGLWIGLFSGTYIVAMTLVGERFRGADLVTANASFGLLWGLGILIGPFLSGTAMDIWDPNGFPGVLAAVTTLALAVALFRRWQARRR